MSKRPRLSANLRAVVTGPFPESAVPAIARAGTGLALSEAAGPLMLGAQGETAAAIVVDALATATMLSCLAWSQSAMLPLRLAALAWRESAPRAACGQAEHRPR